MRGFRFRSSLCGSAFGRKRGFRRAREKNSGIQDIHSEYNGLLSSSFDSTLLREKRPSFILNFLDFNVYVRFMYKMMTLIIVAELRENAVLASSSLICKHRWVKQ